MIIQAFIEGFTFGVKIIGALTSIVVASVLILVADFIVKRFK